jgi:hypothetical protein
MKRMTVKELRESLKKMRRLAHEALDLADRCHGGHSYESMRSRMAQKCCDVRIQVDDLKALYTSEAERQQAAGL